MANEISLPEPLLTRLLRPIYVLGLINIDAKIFNINEIDIYICEKYIIDSVVYMPLLCGDDRQY